MPSTFTVTTTRDVVDPADGKLSLREAISRANNHKGGDVIALPAGVFRIAIAGAGEDGNLTGDFDVSGSTLFLGAGAGATVVDGQGLDRVFDVLGFDPGSTTVPFQALDRVIDGLVGAPGSMTVVFQGLTVRNGLVDAGDGGGIRVSDANLVVRDCAVTGNQAPGGGGGGISNDTLPGTGDVKLVRSLIAHNVTGGDGGGVSVLGNEEGLGSVLTILGSTVRRNLAVNAGGIRASVVNLTDSNVSGNTAANTGGGILATTAMLTNSTVSDNSAVDVGGGIAADRATLTNSTVSDNSVHGEGGGISVGVLSLVRSTVEGNFGIIGGGVSAVRATLTNSTISDNSAGDSGGGLRATDAILTNSTVSGNSADLRGGGILVGAVTLLNVTITDNRAREGGGVFLLAGGTSSVRNTIIADNLVDSAGAGPDVSGAFTSGGHNLIGDGTGGTGFTNGVDGDMVGTSTNPID
ncbi:MAG TPA: CSLREA domain-containing protein, partial [Gemmata sp.]|nr:CSLREA domain-containing protein [Gemmata sp.]